MTLPDQRIHGAGCDCTRCTGFQPGHDLSVRHGAYSILRLQPRAKSLRDEIAALRPIESDYDAAILDILGMTLAQVERAGLVLAIEQAESAADGKPSERLDRLANDARAWVNTSLRLLDALGMTPTSRARLGLDIARTEDALAQLAAAGAEIRVRRGIGVDGD